MNRVFSFGAASFGAALALSFLVFCTSASALQVSNSLQPAPPPQMDFAGLQAKGYIFYKPEDVKKILSEAGFTILQDQKAASDDGVIVTAVVAKQVFLFAFFDCFEGGCFIMRPLHIVPTSDSGFRVTASMVNDLNVNFPVGGLIATPKGDVVVRSTLVAAPECAQACLDANLGVFINTTGYAHKLLQEQQSRSVVDGSDFVPRPKIAQVSLQMASLQMASFRIDGDFREVVQRVLATSPYNIAAASGEGVDLSLAISLKDLPGFENWDLDWPALVSEVSK